VTYKPVEWERIVFMKKESSVSVILLLLGVVVITILVLLGVVVMGIVNNMYLALLPSTFLIGWICGALHQMHTRSGYTPQLPVQEPPAKSPAVTNQTPHQSVDLKWVEFVHARAQAGYKPEDEELWLLEDMTGCTTAHVFASSHKLPVDFKYWGVCTKKGLPVAHVAAGCGTLPEGFSEWTIQDRYGNSVAHIAARYGYLPEGFTKWDLHNKQGETVANVHEEFLKHAANWVSMAKEKAELVEREVDTTC
jgi:hypothetical protein